MRGETPIGSHDAGINQARVRLQASAMLLAVLLEGRVKAGFQLAAAPALFVGVSHIPGLHLPWIEGVSVILLLPGSLVLDFLPFSVNRKFKWYLIFSSSLFFRSTVFCLPFRYVPVTCGCRPRRTVVVMSRCDHSSRKVLR